MPTLTRADLLWISKFLSNYDALVQEYPELFSVDDIDTVKIVRQLIEEKLA